MVMRSSYLLIIPCLVLSVVAQNNIATLSGRVRDITGRGIPHTLVELRADKSPGRYFKTESDDSGSYSFVNLPADEFTLRLQRAGFASLTVQQVQVGEGEQKIVLPLQLQIGLNCGGHGVVDHLLILASPSDNGGIRGSVKLDQGPNALPGRPIEGVDVALLCSVDSSCRKTKTNSNGEFMFLDLPAKHYAISFRAMGFYSLFLPGFSVQAGVESNYYPVAIEACPRGDCDPSHRPKRPVALCE